METTASSDIAAKSKKRFRILIGICIVVAIVLKLGFIFFFLGMLPAMVAYVIDHDKHKYIFSTVTTLNLAGAFPYVMDIFMQGSTFGAVKNKLMDPVVWLTMYGAAGLGWGLVWVSPILATIVLEGVYQGRRVHLESVQKKLEEEWGSEIKPQK